MIELDATADNTILVFQKLCKNRTKHSINQTDFQKLFLPTLEAMKMSEYSTE